VNVLFWHKADIGEHQLSPYPITEDTFCIYPIMCAFSQTILLKVINLHICTVYIGGNYECRQVIRQYNASYVFPFGLWNIFLLVFGIIFKVSFSMLADVSKTRAE
jgi:hypothetical protein